MQFLYEQKNAIPELKALGQPPLMPKNEKASVFITISATTLKTMLFVTFLEQNMHKC